MDSLFVPGRGPFTLRDARAEGLTDRDLRVLLRTNCLTRLRGGVLIATAELGAVAEKPAELHAIQVRGLQAGFATPVVAAASSAAQIYGLEFMDPPTSDLVVMTGDLKISGTRRDGYRLRSARLPDEHVTLRHGVRLTNPARTVVDLCAELSFVGGVVVAESALRRRLVTVAELEAMAEWPVFRRGIQKVRRVIAFLDPLAESPLESASRAVTEPVNLFEAPSVRNY